MKCENVVAEFSDLANHLIYMDSVFSMKMRKVYDMWVMKFCSAISRRREYNVALRVVLAWRMEATFQGRFQMLVFHTSSRQNPLTLKEAFTCWACSCKALKLFLSRIEISIQRKLIFFKRWCLAGWRLCSISSRYMDMARKALAVITCSQSQKRSSRSERSVALRLRLKFGRVRFTWRVLVSWFSVVSSKNEDIIEKRATSRIQRHLKDCYFNTWAGFYERRIWSMKHDAKKSKYDDVKVSLYAWYWVSKRKNQCRIVFDKLQGRMVKRTFFNTLLQWQSMSHQTIVLRYKIDKLQKSTAHYLRQNKFCHWHQELVRKRLHLRRQKCASRRKCLLLCKMVLSTWGLSCSHSGKLNQFVSDCCAETAGKKTMCRQFHQDKYKCYKKIIGLSFFSTLQLERASSKLKTSIHSWLLWCHRSLIRSLSLIEVRQARQQRSAWRCIFNYSVNRKYRFKIYDKIQRKTIVSLLNQVIRRWKACQLFKKFSVNQRNLSVQRITHRLKNYWFVSWFLCASQSLKCKKMIETDINLNIITVSKLFLSKTMMTKHMRLIYYVQARYSRVCFRWLQLWKLAIERFSEHSRKLALSFTLNSAKVCKRRIVRTSMCSKICVGSYKNQKFNFQSIYVLRFMSAWQTYACWIRNYRALKNISIGRAKIVLCSKVLSHWVHFCDEAVFSKRSASDAEVNQLVVSLRTLLGSLLIKFGNEPSCSPVLKVLICVIFKFINNLTFAFADDKLHKIDECPGSPD